MSGPDIDRERFWRLLPEFHRRRDIETDGALRALLDAWSEQAGLIQADIARQYDNWFLETCQDWVVPYIGDLIGCRPVHGAGSAGLDEGRGMEPLARSLVPRREVGNTIRYRRRKGTVGLLEQLAHDITGWPALAVELRRLVLATPHVRMAAALPPGTANLRRRALDTQGGPDDSLGRTVEVRRLSSPISRGRVGPHEVALYVARHDAVPVTKGAAVCATAKGPHCFLLSALGLDVPLYRPGDPQSRVLPGPLTRAALARPGALDGLYGEGRAVMLWTQTGRTGKVQPLDGSRLVPADLRRWSQRPSAGKVAFDPQSGRLMFPEGEAPTRVIASLYEGAYGAAGASERPRRLSPEGSRRVFRIGGGRGAPATLGAALAAWRAAGVADALILFSDSGSYDEHDLRVDLAAGQRLEIRAASRTRSVIRLFGRDASTFDPLRLSGAPDSRLILDGLTFCGNGLSVEGGFGTLWMRHCTLLPAPGPPPKGGHPAGLRIEGPATLVHAALSHLSAIHVRGSETDDEPLRLELVDSIVDGGGADAIGGDDDHAYVALDVRRCTVFGQCAVHQLDVAQDSLFTRRVRVARRQIGHLRFCYLPLTSSTPRRFECLPAPDDAHARPVFVSLASGMPGYAQLAIDSPEAIRRGASDQSELGAFHDLFAPQRESNLRDRLDEYAPAAVDVGIVYVT